MPFVVKHSLAFHYWSLLDIRKKFGNMPISPEKAVTSAEDVHPSSSMGLLLREDRDFTEFTQSAPCSEFDDENLQENKEEDKKQGITTTNIGSISTPNQPSYKFVTPKDFELLTVIGVGSFGR